MHVNEHRTSYPRWVGVVLSLLISGAGLYLAGERRAGLRWFLALSLLWFANVVLAPMRFIPGLGDYAKNSLDSRHFGAIVRANIIGKATKIYWPPARVGDIR